MSLNRRAFITAVLGAPVAAKAIERIIAGGGSKPTPVPVKPAPQPPYEQAMRTWDPTVYAVSGYVSMSTLIGGSDASGRFVIPTLS